MKQGAKRRGIRKEERCNLQRRVRRYLKVHSAMKCTDDRLARQSCSSEPRCAPARSWSGFCGASPFSGQVGWWGTPPISLAAGSGFLSGRFVSSAAKYRSGRLAEDGDCEISALTCTSIATHPCAVKASCPCRVRVFRRADWAGSWGSRAEEPRYSQIACFLDEFPGQMCSARPIEGLDKSH